MTGKKSISRSLAPGAMYASTESVELDQSAENVIAAINAAMKEYPIDEQ